MLLVPELGRRVPEHFEAGNQYYDLSLTGLRYRVESLKGSDAATYAILDGEVTRLEHRRTAAVALLSGGLAAPLIAFGAASVARSQDSCPMPSASTPNFEMASQAWMQCNEDRNSSTATYIGVGFGIMIVGVVGALVVAPKRSDLLEVVNLHNRLQVEPLRLQFGYDPARKSAQAGAALSF